METNIYTKESGQNLEDLNLSVGKYRFTLSLFELGLDIWDYSVIPLLRATIGHDLNPLDKECILLEVEHIEDQGLLEFVVDLRENPIPAIAILYVVLAIGGVSAAAYLVHSISQITEDVSTITEPLAQGASQVASSLAQNPILLFAIIGLIGYVILKK